MSEVSVLPSLSAAPASAANGNPAGPAATAPSASGADKQTGATGDPGTSAPGPFAAELHRQLNAGKSATTSPTGTAPAKKVDTKDAVVADPGALGLAALMATTIKPTLVAAPGGPDAAAAKDGKGSAASSADSALLADALSTSLATKAASDKTAITAALATPSGDLPAVHAKSADSAPPDSAFRNLLATVQGTPYASQPANPLPVAAAFGSDAWASGVGDKLVWMVGQQTQHAELVLNPPNLGRVEVSLSLHGDQASAQFLSHNPMVRDALESAMPRLREMLAGAGVNLGQTQVGSGAAGNSGGQSPNNRGNGDNSYRSQASLGQVGGALSSTKMSTRWLRRGNGMVDLFA